MSRSRGFTLIEMLVVILILSILAALLIPAAVHVIGIARQAAAETVASQVVQSLTVYEQTTMQLPPGDGYGSRPGRRAEQEVPRQVALAGGRHVGYELTLERQHALRAAVQTPARLRRLDTPTGAVEELRSEALLERAHLERDGGLCHAQAIRRLREAPTFDDRAECGELARIHKRTLSVRS